MIFFLVFSFFLSTVLITGACNINPFIVIINRQEIITFYIHLFVMYQYAIGYRLSAEHFTTSNTSYIILQQINTINTNGAHIIIRWQQSKNAYKTFRNWNQEEIKHCVVNRDTQCPAWSTNMRRIVWIAMSLLYMNSEWYVWCYPFKHMDHLYKFWHFSRSYTLDLCQMTEL